MTMATNQELHQSILTNLSAIGKELELLSDDAASDLNRALVNIDNTLSEYAEYIREDRQQQRHRQIPYPGPKLAALGATMDMSGWCSECGEYLDRKSHTAAILNPDGTTHRHPQPWRLGPKPPETN